MKNSIIKDALMLTVITLVAGLLLGLVYEITKEPIATSKAKAKQESYMAVFTDASEFVNDENVDLTTSADVLSAAGLTGETIDEVMMAVDSTGNALGYVISVTTNEGYGGNITLALGIQNDGTLNGVEILSISETAGLGMKATDEEFKNQYAGKNVESFAYTKTGATADNEIDAISGATITTNAVTNAVNAGLVYFKSIVGGGK